MRTARPAPRARPATRPSEASDEAAGSERVSLFRRDGGGGGKVDWLIVGLGNPGDQYARTRHNVGFEVVALAAERWQPAEGEEEYAGLYTDGRTGPGGPRVGVLLPQTYMNDSGRAAGPARGALQCGPRPRGRGL